MLLWTCSLHLVMFDIDGTLIHSCDFDETCYLEAAREVLGIKISPDWNHYHDPTDAGILNEILERYEISGDRREICKKFKRVFTNRISDYIRRNQGKVYEIKGAAQFIRYLCRQKNVEVAIATGGWEEPAKLKLEAAGIDIEKCAFASSSDHYSRTGIMQMAESRIRNHDSFMSRTYFGDAPWDLEASKKLNYTFISVGNRIKHTLQLDDYIPMEKAIAVLGL